MTANERLREVRKALALSQGDFAAKIGITAAGISRIEIGDRALTEQVLLAVCNAYNINEAWLRHGAGDMLVTPDLALLNAVDNLLASNNHTAKKGVGRADEAHSGAVESSSGNTCHAQRGVMGRFIRIGEVTNLSYEIGARLRKYREAQNLTQKEFAKRIGVSNSRVSNWEQGLNRPDVDLLADICAVLNVSPSELLDVQLSPFEFSNWEKTLVMQYRKRPEFQQAVNLLLDMGSSNDDA